MALCEIDGDLFLKPSGKEGVFHLNVVAALLWQLLGHSVSRATAVATLREAFPRADPRQIKRDVKAAFDALEAGGLIRTAAAFPATADGEKIGSRGVGR